jgi:hypothetical protein
MVQFLLSHPLSFQITVHFENLEQLRAPLHPISGSGLGSMSSVLIISTTSQRAMLSRQAALDADEGHDESVDVPVPVRTASFMDALRSSSLQAREHVRGTGSVDDDYYSLASKDDEAVQYASPPSSSPLADHSREVRSSTGDYSNAQGPYNQ